MVAGQGPRARQEGKLSSQRSKLSPVHVSEADGAGPQVPDLATRQDAPNLGLLES